MHQPLITPSPFHAVSLPTIPPLSYSVGQYRIIIFILLLTFFLPIVGTAQSPAESEEGLAQSGTPGTLFAGGTMPGMADLTPEQQAALQAYRSVEMENMINQLFKLEGRINSLEREQLLSRQSIQRAHTLDSLRSAADLNTQRARYLESLTRATGMVQSIDSLRSLYDWQAFLGEASELADPTTYEGFSKELKALREEQKNSLQLPNIEFLNNPEFTTFYTLASTLGTKDDPEERAKIVRLATILDFALQADRQLDYIATELAFAEHRGNALYDRAVVLRDKLYGLVNLEPGKLDDARRKFFAYQFSTDFTQKEGEKIAAYQSQMNDLADEYGNYLFALAHALDKAAFSLDQVRAHGGEELLAEELENRKADLQLRIEEAAASVARHGGGNG